MVEVTQADREAAASGYFAWCSGNPVIPSKMKDGKADDHSMVQAFTRHRTEATAALEERVKLLEAERDKLLLQAGYIPASEIQKATERMNDD